MLPDKCAVRIEELEAVIAGIRHDDAAVVPDAHAGWRVELAVAVSSAADHADHITILIQDLDAVIAGVRHHDVAVGIDGNAAWAAGTRLPRCLPGRI